MEAELGRVFVNVLFFLAIWADVFQNNQHELEAKKTIDLPPPLWPTLSRQHVDDRMIPFEVSGAPTRNL